MSNYSNTNHDLSQEELLSKIEQLEESNKQLSEENQKLKNVLTTQLEKKEGEFQAIIETIPASILISTIKGEILFINQKASETFGVAKDSIKEYNTGDFYENFGDHPKIIQLFQQQGFVKNYQIKVKTNQGKYFWANLNIHPFNYQNKKVLLSVLLDITELKTELKEITQQKEKLINQYLDILYLFNFSLDLLCIVNFSGYFVQLNPAWETVLGYSSIYN